MLYETQNTNANMHVYHIIQFWSILVRKSKHWYHNYYTLSQRKSLPVLIYVINVQVHFVHLFNLGCNFHFCFLLIFVLLNCSWIRQTDILFCMYDKYDHLTHLSYTLSEGNFMFQYLETTTSTNLTSIMFLKLLAIATFR